MKHMKNRLRATLAFSLIAISIFPLNSYALPNLDGLSNEERIQVIDNTIIETMEKISEMEEDIKNNEKELEEKNKLLIDTKKEYQSKKELINNTSSLSITNSKNGNLSILEMLLNSDSISEFLQNLEISKTLIKQKNKSLKTLNTRENQLAELKEEILKEQENLNKEKELLKEEQDKLEGLKNRVLEEIRIEEERLEQLQQQNSNSGLNNSNSVYIPEHIIPDINTPISDKATTVINYAKQFLGVPYVWGGTSPSGFDCSGFTSYVYKKALGISLPRTARQQQNFGKRINISELQAGDLIFFGYPAHHVGIYIGNGKYLHAPRTGDVVKIANVPWKNVSTATRVL